MLFKEPWFHNIEYTDQTDWNSSMAPPSSEQSPNDLTWPTRYHVAWSSRIHPSHLILQCCQNFTGPRQLSNTSVHLLLWPYRCAHPSQIFSLNYSPSETILQHLHCESLAIPYWGEDWVPRLWTTPVFSSPVVVHTALHPSVCMNIHVYTKWFHMQRMKV